MRASEIVLHENVSLFWNRTRRHDRIVVVMLLKRLLDEVLDEAHDGL